MEARESREGKESFGLFGPRDRNLEAPEPVHVDALGRSTGHERPDLGAGGFLEVACSLLEVELDRVASSRRDSRTAALRKLIAAVGIEQWGQKTGQLARLLHKHPMAVSRWVSDAARQRHEDSIFANEMEKLDEALSTWALAAQRRGELTLGKERNESQ